VGFPVLLEAAMFVLLVFDDETGEDVNADL
jgi:hypothetical protein